MYMAVVYKLIFLDISIKFACFNNNKVILTTVIYYSYCECNVLSMKHDLALSLYITAHYAFCFQNLVIATVAKSRL